MYNGALLGGSGGIGVVGLVVGKLNIEARFARHDRGPLYRSTFTRTVVHLQRLERSNGPEYRAGDPIPGEKPSFGVREVAEVIGAFSESAQTASHTNIAPTVHPTYW